MTNMHTIWRGWTTAWVRLAAVGMFTTLLLGCRAITETKLPDGVDGPDTYNSRAGAERLTQAARVDLARTITKYIVSSGLLTDELGTIIAPSPGYANQDKRSGHFFTDPPPHSLRSLARLARSVIGKYVSGETSGWQALLLMYEAYAEILIADGWCSGVPLSTLDFEGDWTYRPGSSTDEIYTHAIALLDSADARAADSVSLQSTIRVLKARAQLALGRYADAKQTVQGVDGAFRYELRIAFDEGAVLTFPGYRYTNFSGSISDYEGINGLPYRSSGDPRTQATPITGVGYSTARWFPVKYIAADSSTFVLASGIEAQLILAEAALQSNQPQEMLTILNALRTNGTFTVETDTLWNAGSGGVAGLRPIAPLPPTPAEQRQLLFAERAAWLFLTGSRQGDLRRLVRKYGLNREQVYPTGTYTAPGYVDVYGSDISFGISDVEFRNPQFTGCRYDE